MQDHQRNQIVFVRVLHHALQEVQLVVHIQRADRFVQHQDFGTAQHDLGKHDELPLSAGKPHDVAVCQMADAQLRHDTCGFVQQFVADVHVQRVHAAEQHDFQRGQRGFGGGVLRHIAYTFAPALQVDFAQHFVAVADGAFVRHFAENRFHQRGFARAVGAEHGIDFALFQRQIDIVGDHIIAAPDVYVFKFQHFRRPIVSLIQSRRRTARRQTT